MRSLLVLLLLSCREPETRVQYAHVEPTLEAGSQSSALCYETDWLEGEQLIDVICGPRTVLLTTASLIVVEKPAKKRRTQSALSDYESPTIRLVEHHSKTDMRDILHPGFVAWTTSDDDAYFLTQDGRVSVVPFGEMGDTIGTYSLGGDVHGARIVYFDKHVFVGPVSAELRVLDLNKTDDGFRSQALPPNAGAAPILHIDHGRLYFGATPVPVSHNSD
jgi:hypothetical protein